MHLESKKNSQGSYNHELKPYIHLINIIYVSLNVL